MRRSLVLFSSILMSCPRARAAGSRLGRDISDRRARLPFDLHRNRDHLVSLLGVFGGLPHHLAVTRALSHEVAAGYQIGASELSRHGKTLFDSSRSSRMSGAATRRSDSIWPRGSRGPGVPASNADTVSAPQAPRIRRPSL